MLVLGAAIKKVGSTLGIMGCAMLDFYSAIYITLSAMLV